MGNPLEVRAVDELTRRFLAGELVSEGDPFYGNLNVVNDLPVTLRVCSLGADGALYLRGGADPMKEGGAKLPLNWYCALTALDDSLVKIFTVEARERTANFRITGSDLCEPGDIGPVPAATAQVPVPNDSRAVLVGAGRAAKGQVVRSQLWKRADDSISLAPGEEVTTTYTSVSGIQKTTSDTQTIASSLSVSASAKWGVISSSVSASLNATSAKSHQYVVTETDTRYESRTYHGDESEVRTIIRWKMLDVVTILGDDGAAKAQIVTAQHPDIVRVYRQPANEAALPEAPEITEAQRDAAKRALEETRSEPDD